jgi:hypothetical protein
MIFSKAESQNDLSDLVSNSQVITLNGEIFSVTLRYNKKIIADTDTCCKNFASLCNSRVVLSFRSDSLESSWVSDKKFGPCEPVIFAADNNSIIFTTTCASEYPEIKAVWVGVAKRNKIHGTFSWLMPGGKILKFVFIGSGKKRIPDDKQGSITLVD